MLEVRQIYVGIPLENLSRIFILNPPSLARAVFNPNKKSKKRQKKEKKRKYKEKKRNRKKEFFTCCASPAVH